MKTYTAVEIANKTGIPRSTVVRYLAANVEPAGTTNKIKHLSWIYDSSAIDRLSTWYKSKKEVTR
jgi:response regulator of citrate/malate metabolism